MAEVSEGLCNIREYVLLENKTSSTIKHGDSDGISLMRMHHLQNIVTSMQSSPYRPIVARLTTDVCVQISVYASRVCSNRLPYKFNDFIFRESNKLKNYHLLYILTKNYNIFFNKN